MSKRKRVLKSVTAEVQLAREIKLAADVIAAVVTYVRAGNPPNLKDAAIVERIAAEAALSLRRELSGDKTGFMWNDGDRPAASVVRKQKGVPVSGRRFRR